MMLASGNKSNLANGLESGTFVALSSIELSTLSFIEFDPGAVAAIRQGTRVNIVDADDSGVLRHIVALPDYAESDWRTLASILPGFPESTVSLPLVQIFHGRIVPPMHPAPRYFRMEPLELAAALRADHPQAFETGSAIAARIHTLEQLKSNDGFHIHVECDALAEPGLTAAASAMPVPNDGALWGHDMLLHLRVVPDDAAAERAWSLIVELHAALHALHEAPFGAGLDFDTYLGDMAAQLHSNPGAIKLLAENRNPELDIVRDILKPPAGQTRENAGSRLTVGD